SRPYTLSLSLLDALPILLTESQLFSSPVGTEMFHFPTFPPHTLYIQMRVTTHNMPRGSPIRTPSDHSSFTNSPRLIAGYRVLHRSEEHTSELQSRFDLVC